MEYYLLKTKEPGLTVLDSRNPGRAFFKFDENGLFATDKRYIIARAKYKFDYEKFATKDALAKRVEEIIKERTEDSPKEETTIKKETSEGVDLTSMTKKELLEYAMKNYKAKLNPRAKNDDLIIEIGKLMEGSAK